MVTGQLSIPTMISGTAAACFKKAFRQFFHVDIFYNADVAGLVHAKHDLMGQIAVFSVTVRSKGNKIQPMASDLGNFHVNRLLQRFQRPVRYFHKQKDRFCVSSRNRCVKRENLPVRSGPCKDQIFGQDPFSPAFRNAITRGF